MRKQEFDQQHQNLISQIAKITHIERGTLTEEFRDSPNPDGDTPIKTGPYYKHQCWENKRNRSRRVAADEVPLLREHLLSGQHFDELINALTALNIDHSRQQRAEALSPSDDIAQTSKKNSSNKRSKNATAKPKPSSKTSPNDSSKRGYKA